MANTRFSSGRSWYDHPPSSVPQLRDFYEGNNPAKLDILHHVLNWKTTLWSKSRNAKAHFQKTSSSQRQEDQQSTRVLIRKSQRNSSSRLSRWDTSHTAPSLNSSKNQQLLLQCEMRYQHFSFINKGSVLEGSSDS